MARWPFFLLGVLSGLAVFVVYALDPDHFDVAQLLDVSGLHHETFEVALAFLSPFFFFLYARRAKQGAAT